MPRGGMRRAHGILLLLVCIAATGAQAQDALRGKRLYHDTAGLTRATVSCIDCHGGLPGALHGLGKAAGDPAAIDYAVNAIHQMSPLRGRLNDADRADLAAYIARPDIPSPELKITTEGPARSPWSAERLEFALAPAGSSPSPSVIRLSNSGALPVRLLSTPMLSGPHAEQFIIAANDCMSGMTLSAAQSCSLTVAFRPQGPAGLRSASVGIQHDWIRGAVNVALIGRVAQQR